MARGVNYFLIFLLVGTSATLGWTRPGTGPIALATPSPTGSAPPDSAYALPNNYFGINLSLTEGAPGTRGRDYLRWARYLVGRWGYVRTVFHVDTTIRKPTKPWADFVDACYRLELIPVIHIRGQLKPAADADEPDDYRSIAAAIQRVVTRLPRCDLCPLYIELWSEPNDPGGGFSKSDATAYARFFRQCAAAIRSIGDKRIKILNGGLANGTAWTKELCQADPEFINTFDLWSTHSSPQNYPPSVNFHDKTVTPETTSAIDAYLLEWRRLCAFGRRPLRVMITATGYDLGNRTHTRVGGYPVIDEFTRAEYMVQAFRDHWSKWPEMVAVLPMGLCDPNTPEFDWVYGDSDTNADGSPNRPHYQYTVVAALAKPTDMTGAISGKVTVAGLGTPLVNVRVTAGAATNGYMTDPLGNYFLAKLKPKRHTIEIDKRGYKTIRKRIKVKKAENVVLDVELEPDGHATLAGTVRNGDDGKPLRNVEIVLEPGGLTTKTDRHGQYEFEACLPARYKIVATAKGLHRYEALAANPLLPGRSNRLDFVLGTREAPDAENMLHNPSMEDLNHGASRAGIAVGFEPVNPKNYSAHLVAVSDRVAHTGCKSQQMKARTGQLVLRQMTETSSVQPGTLYVIGTWVRADISDRKGTAWISLDFTKNDGSIVQTVESKNRVAGQSKQWTWVHLQATAPQGAKRLSLKFHTQGQSGSAYFDDAYAGRIRNGRPQRK